VKVEALKELSHCNFPPFNLVHNTVGIVTVRLFDEAQQVLLIHAGGSVDVSVHLEWQKYNRKWMN